MNVISKTAILVALLGSTSQVAIAQENSNGNALDEIIVTATKRAENVQSVPIAVTAITASVMENKGIDNLAEAAFLVPNLKLNHGRDTSSQATIHIRGVGQSDEHGDPGVGIYVDGVFLARSYGALFDLYDLERMEVLRGPQGTLFGRNTIGGAISLVTVKPGNEQEFSAQIGYESYGGLFLKGSAQVPLIEDVLSTRIFPYPHLKLKSRVLFSDITEQKKVIVIPEKDKQHRLRRTVCSGWRNKQWHGRLMAFMELLVGENASVNMPLSPRQSLIADASPIMFTSPVSTEIKDVADDDSEELDQSTIGFIPTDEAI